MAATLMDSLMNQARCFESCIPDGMQLAVMNYLLYQIALNGTGGGGFPLLQFIDFIYWEDTGPNPSGPPPDTSFVWTVMFRDGAANKTWDPVRMAWF